eukprot:TRINITY_DN41097_c0_g1_i1.p2 TRINITY_DN41097_c0_g1~~TRINITY_DN41097_c0_g1_i1.p2  ORF type:complete len:101 (+),score=6.56 TRINITY_DN41097_c0_g1_i1:116-418(+)
MLHSVACISNCRWLALCFPSPSSKVVPAPLHGITTTMGARIIPIICNECKVDKKTVCLELCAALGYEVGGTGVGGEAGVEVPNGAVGEGEVSQTPKYFFY